MNVLLFGVLADVVGKSEIRSDAKDVSSLKENMFHDFPQLKKYKFQIAVNKERVENNISLNDNDEIALLPPFAGG